MLDGLTRIAPLLTSELDPDRLMQRLTEEATRLIGADFGAFFYNVVEGSGESYMLYTLAGAPREAWRQAFESLMPSVDAFAPDLIMVSAGFDAHARDPVGDASQNLEAEDFAWATRAIAAVANRRAKGRIVSSLEGGYGLEALGRSATAHVRALSER